MLRKNKQKREIRYPEIQNRNIHLEVIQNPAIYNLTEKAHVHVDVHVCVYNFISFHRSWFKSLGTNLAVRERVPLCLMRHCTPTNAHQHR